MVQFHSFFVFQDDYICFKRQNTEMYQDTLSSEIGRCQQKSGFLVDIKENFNFDHAICHSDVVINPLFSGKTKPVGFCVLALSAAVLLPDCNAFLSGNRRLCIGKNSASP